MDTSRLHEIMTKGKCMQLVASPAIKTSFSLTCNKDSSFWLIIAWIFPYTAILQHVCTRHLRHS